MSAIDPAPTAVADLAESCVRFVKDALGLPLDYTPETLPILDHYVRGQAADTKPEVAELIATAAGAYFGEVVRRVLPGARWHAPEGDYAAYRIEFEPFFLSFNPIGVAMEVLAADDVADYNAHFSLLDEAREPVQRSLRSIADVAREDYYTFSMRLEVLQQIADVLGGLESAQPSRRHFGPEVYAAASGRTVSLRPS